MACSPRTRCWPATVTPLRTRPAGGSPSPTTGPPAPARGLRRGDDPAARARAGGRADRRARRRCRGGGTGDGLPLLVPRGRLVPARGACEGRAVLCEHDLGRALEGDLGWFVEVAH